MSAKGLKSIFFVGEDIINSEIDPTTKTITVHTGNAKDSEVEGASKNECEFWQHVGYASRPSNVSSSGKNSDACQGIVINRSDYDIVIASRDIRYQPDLDVGETCIYATGLKGEAQANITLKNTGSIVIKTKEGNTSSGNPVEIIINTDGSIKITGKTVDLGQDPIDFVALSTKVMTELSKIQKWALTHTHAYVNPETPLASLFTLAAIPALSPPSSVAAATVKAK